ncbi:hypothetical protein E4L40_22925 [Pseudomonas putida]|nr:hypothetical protein E4L40_22925 [Pseudomonas putida]
MQLCLRRFGSAERRSAGGIGRFISHDPISLLGGDNLYIFAPSTTGWIDPWGLSCRPEYLGRTPGKFNRTGRKLIGMIEVDSLELSLRRL